MALPPSRVSIIASPAQAAQAWLGTSITLGIVLLFVMASGVVLTRRMLAPRGVIVERPFRLKVAASRRTQRKKPRA